MAELGHFQRRVNLLFRFGLEKLSNDDNILSYFIPLAATCGDGGDGCVDSFENWFLIRQFRPTVMELFSKQRQGNDHTTKLCVRV